MTEVPHIRINGDTLCITLHGKPYTVGSDHPNFVEISNLLEEDSPDAVRLVNLLDKAKAIQKKFATDGEDNIEVRDGQVFYKSLPVHNALTKRIIEFTDKNMPTRPLIRFLDNMMENPSHRAVKELYDFLENKGMAITTDGCFLAYKAVSSDFKDKRTGEFDNSVGQVVEIQRNMVDDDRDNQCSNGLHVGHYEYARSFASYGEPVLLVKVNPRDAVSVPTDSNCGKLRTCRYEVLRVYECPDSLEEDTRGEELPDSLYDPEGNDLAQDGAYDDLGEGNCSSGDVEDEDDCDDSREEFHGDCDHSKDDVEIEIEIEIDPEDEEDSLDEAATTYMVQWNRDNLCRYAAERGIFPSAEAARRAGKPMVAEALAKADLEG